MLLMDDDADAKGKHFNYDKIVEQQNLSKKKRKKMMRKGEELLDQDDFQVSMTSLQNDRKASSLNMQMFEGVSVPPSPGERPRPSLPGHVHLPPVQPGPLPPCLQEHQSHAEHPEREAAQTTAGGAGSVAGGAGSAGGGAGPAGDHALQGDEDGPESVSAGQIHQEQDGRVPEPEEAETDQSLIPEQRVGLFPANTASITTVVALSEHLL